VRRSLARDEVPDAGQQPSLIPAGEVPLLVRGGLRQVATVLLAVQNHRRYGDLRLLRELLVQLVVLQRPRFLAPALQVRVRGDLGEVRVVPGLRGLIELLAIEVPGR
jgi:hypothetical protein